MESREIKIGNYILIDKLTRYIHPSLIHQTRRENSLINDLAPKYQELQAPFQ